MNFRRKLRAALALLLATAIACPPARALVTFNDSHDHIYVTGSISASRDSNIFANRDSPGDVVYSSSLIADYARRAGWIGVNASVAVNASVYGKTKSENFKNPSYSVELTKQTGRTTGSITLSAARESRADAAVNIRSSSWNYDLGLNFAYPIIERFKLSGGFGYSGRKYIGETGLANLSTYSANTSLWYLLTTARDLVTTYRYRYTQTSFNTATVDHALTVGVDGRIIKGINGALNIGYQFRTPTGPNSHGSAFQGLTASGSATYAVNRKLHLSGQISKDFSTTGADSSVDTTTGSVNAQYRQNSRWSLNLSAGAGDSRFLGEAGRIVRSLGPPADLGPNRHDTFANWDANIGYSVTEHLKATLGYGWFHNWSNVAFANFSRTTSWNVNYSSRW
jgi:hypothetical protein